MLFNGKKSFLIAYIVNLIALLFIWIAIPREQAFIWIALVPIVVFGIYYMFFEKRGK